VKWLLQHQEGSVAVPGSDGDTTIYEQSEKILSAAEALYEVCI
jgi:hypothetical protein